MSQEEEFYQPQYPALAKCLLIDARWSSRQDLSKEIKSSGLFDSVVEAKFVDNGLTLLQREPIDACFFGPTVSQTTIIDFVRRCLTATSAEDCAFISVVREEENEEANILLKNGVHGIIPIPCSKKAFCESVVNAVVSANADGVWAGISLLIREENLKAEEAERRNEVQKLATSALRRATNGLNDIIDSYRSKKFGLDEYGEPTSETMYAIEKVCDNALASLPADKTPRGFQPYYRSTLKQWFVDVVETNPRMAQEKLRKRILNFREPKAG